MPASLRVDESARSRASRGEEDDEIQLLIVHVFVRGRATCTADLGSQLLNRLCFTCDLLPFLVIVCPGPTTCESLNGLLCSFCS